MKLEGLVGKVEGVGQSSGVPNWQPSLFVDPIEGFVLLNLLLTD